jgi:DNA-binding NtrC family response regulator
VARNRILLIEDEPGIRFGIRDFLEGSGYAVSEAATCSQAREVFRASRPDAVILDYRLPDGDALQLLRDFKEADPDVPLVVLTAYGSIDLAVQAIKEGAEQFLTKPVELPSLRVLLERLLDAQRNRQKQLARKSREAREDIDPFQGASAAIRALAEQARRIVTADSPVLIQGETGTGKGVLARWLHSHGPRRDEACVDLNCAGLSREFLETELFGHERGAFTGAVSSKPGLLEIAHRGTVFLDEIGDVDFQVQPKLLKVLEDKRFHRLGGVREIHVDIRLISATHQDLSQLVREKKFRSDLYFRINIIPIVLPPLRQRIEDIPLLAHSVVERLGNELGRGPVRLSPAAEQALQRYPWPGNLRELRNVLERAVLLSPKAVIEPRDLVFESAPIDGSGDDASNLTLLEVERKHIERILAEEKGRVGQAAERLGIPRSSLYQKLKRHGLDTSRF